LVWLLVAAILVVAGVVGTAAGMWLGARQSGPLTSGQPAAGGRPTIVVPSAEASTSPAPAASTPVPTAAAQTSPGQGASEYVVQPGDTLRSIAQDHYGDASQWPRIYDANRDVIGSDPDALQAGTKLTLP
jgi:nucleoid-associated protein YgaU